MANSIVKKLNTAESCATDFETQVIPIGPYVDNVALNIEVTQVTDQQGEFKVFHRISSDSRSKGGARGASGWAPVTLSCLLLVGGANYIQLVSFNQLPIGEIKVTFTAAGSVPDGVCDIWYSGREI